MYFGHGVIQAIADGLPAWANAGLNGVAALLPALGFALLLNIIFEKDLTPYLIIGFVLAAYAGQAITMVGITLIAFAIAMIIYQIRSNQGTVVQSASALDDEWEDQNMAKNDVISVENNITKKDFRKVFWRSFTLLGSFNYEKMEGLAYLYCIEHILKKIYKDDEEGLKQAMLRESAAFNMTIAPAPFVMGISIAMEESVKRDPNFDPASINAIKVSLMGPLSGIGDTFFWGIFRILACSLSIGFAKAGNPIAPFILLILFNIPTFLTRYYGLKIGYTSGNQLLIDLEKSGKMQLFTYCAGILGVAAIGCMIASWVTVSCPLEFTISGNKIVIQEYLDQIMPKLLPLAATLGIYSAIKKNIKITKIISAIVVIGFVLGVFGIIAL